MDRTTPSIGIRTTGKTASLGIGGHGDGAMKIYLK